MIKTHVRKLSLIAGVMSLAAGTPALSDPITVRFMPPEVKGLPHNVCAPRLRDDQIVAQWEAWDQKSLPKKDSYAIQRDMGRLRDLDAAKYQKIVTRIIALLPTVDPGYTDTDQKFDTVRLMLALGEADKVRSQRLIATLLTRSDFSPGSLNTLADFVLSGRGIEADRAAGLKLKVEAAYGGNADAMLDLATLARNGEKVDDWDIEPEIAVNMAFGSLVGVLNAGICDRVGRIAREFSKGELVTKDVAASEAWYKFAADLGDSYSAWKVAEFNLESDEIDKDNAVLIKYMKQAAEGGNMSAMLEMGRTYAEGSLIEKDRAKAFKFYDMAVDAGNQAALVREAQLLEETKDRSPADREAYEKALRKLVKRDQPPPWAFTRLSRLIVAKTGIWEEPPEVRELLEKAVKLGDADAKLDLADLILRQSPDAGGVSRASTLLTDAVEGDGKIDAIADLHRLYLCVSPKGPDIKTASYWSGVEDAAGNKTLEIDPDQVDEISKKNDPLLVASMQTQALYRRPNALAVYQRYLQDTGRTQEVLAFWKKYGSNQVGVDAAVALLDFKQQLLKGNIPEARKSIDAASGAGNKDAGLNFARFLIENYITDRNSLEQAQAILQPLAQAGIGRAVELLEQVEQALAGGQTDTVARYKEAMARYGDMYAQLILAGSADDPQTRDMYYRRAVGSQGCDYDDTMALAEFAVRSNKADDADRWLTIARYLADDDSWRKVKIGDAYQAMNTPQAVQTALELYQEARKQKETSAYYRLVKYYGNDQSSAYAPQAAGNLFIELLKVSPLEEIPGELATLDKLKPAIRNAVTAQVDIKDLYTRSAEAGQPVAMRELAKLIQNGPVKSAAAATEAVDWLDRSAKGGDAEAMYLLSQSYAFGTGVEPSLEKARFWLKKASDAGYQQAGKTLSLMTIQPEG